MRLYSGLSPQFIRDSERNQIAGKLKQAYFKHYRFEPPTSEVRSWQNSLRAMAQILDAGGLRDHGVMLEYQLPQTSRRLDFIICGRDHDKRDEAVIVELKQWDSCHAAVGEKMVSTILGGAEREVLHPSAQVGQYQLYLQDTHTAFYEDEVPVDLAACSYLHNYYPGDNDVLFARQFSETLEHNPLFTADDFGELKDYLGQRLDGGEGLPVLQRVEASRYRPSKKLMNHVGSVIKGTPQYVLLDEQLVAYEKVFSAARAGLEDRHKRTLIIRGGPGTGKSVIALNLMSDLLLEGFNAHYATGSRAFTETLRKVIGTRSSPQIKYFNSYREAQYNEIDVLICDESHRIRKVSHNRFTPRQKRTNTPQIKELIDAAKVSVFFVDDKQVVRPEEIGSSDYVRGAAISENCRIYEQELEAQFRCSGSEGFVNWINNTLGIEQTPNVIWKPEEESFDFQIFESPWMLENAIRNRHDEGWSARLAAGFCWKWSDPNPDGTLVDDVVIGDFQRPWNAKPEAGRLAPGIPKAYHWAIDPAGIDQIGCVYTAQGFDFDYIGVIFGLDLRYDLDRQEWLADSRHSHDTVVKRSKGRFVDLIKNTYRVLLTRGLKGCYVHFMDRDTARFVRSRIE